VSTLVGHFSLWGDFDVEEITARMGISPSAVYLKGEVMDGATAPASVSTWDLYCPDKVTGSMQEQIEALLGMLWSKKDVVAEFASTHTAELNVASSCAGGPAVISLSRETLQRLAELNLKVNCFYMCNEDKDGD